MMNEMIAVCGLDCSTCPAHFAWKNDDQALREKTAPEWSQAFSFDFQPAMINCSGCRVAGEPKIGHCAECKMRSCVAQKGHATCADCGEFPTCAEIRGFMSHAPQAKANLERLRA
jgi:hypothetical protein